MNEEAGLLRVIADAPTDDLPRRIWADWLDDAGQAERAELVRVQLDLARDPCEHYLRVDHCPTCQLRKREGQLLDAHGPEWLAAVLPGWRLRHSADWIEHPGARMGVQSEAAFWRGLVAVLYLPMADFLKQGTEYAKRLTTLARVQLTDRWPAGDEQHTGYRWSGEEVALGSHHYLHPNLMERLPLSRAEGASDSRIYPKEAEALAALSRACILASRNGPRLSDFQTLFTTQQVAELCQVYTATVRDWLDSRQLLGYRMPGTRDWRVPRDRLISFLRESGLSSEHPFPDWGDGDLEGDSERFDGSPHGT